MDLGAYQNIDALDRLARDNGIDIPWCRGYRLMKDESVITQVEIDELKRINAIYITELLIDSDPFWCGSDEYADICIRVGAYHRRSKGYFLVPNNDKKGMGEYSGMEETDDAYTLVSKGRHPMELVYAEYANDMKHLANQARMAMVNTGKIQYSATAKKEYQNEVKSLLDKLDNSDLNRIKERTAQRKANVELQRKMKEYYEENGEKLKGEALKKIGQQALSKAREEVGSISRRERNVEITDREWEAIQAGAISENKLKSILNNADIDKLRERATPRSYNSLSTAQIGRAKAMAASNYTLEEIASKLGVSPSTISKALKGVK